LVRNHAEYPLGPSVFGHLELVWLDSGGREIARELSTPFGSRLPSHEWTKLCIRAVPAPDGAVQAMLNVSLYDRGRDGGSIWVAELECHSHDENAEAYVALSGKSARKRSHRMDEL
jgi:hypothetical protein